MLVHLCEPRIHLVWTAETVVALTRVYYTANTIYVSVDVRQRNCAAATAATEDDIRPIRHGIQSYDGDTMMWPDSVGAGKQGVLHYTWRAVATSDRQRNGAAVFDLIISLGTCS